MTIPSQMQAVFVDDGALVMRDSETPKPADDQVLIKVQYAGLNRADLFQKQGSYPPPDGIPNIPGLEVSGHIAAVGSRVTDWQMGDAVCALLPGGGYAEYALAQADQCLPIPEPLTLEQAAALPECAATVWMALFDEATIQPGESVLIHGGASGIGTTAIQMLNAFGCDVHCTVGSSEKAQICAGLGAKPILYKAVDFVDTIKAVGGVDAVLDIVGGDYINRSLKCLKVGGRLISLALLQGGDVHLQAGRLLLKRLRWIGTTLRSRNNADKAAYLRAVHETVWPWVSSGQLKPVIDSVYPLEDAEKAHEKMQKYLHCGKILLQTKHANSKTFKG